MRTHPNLCLDTDGVKTAPAGQVQRYHNIGNGMRISFSNGIL